MINLIVRSSFLSTVILTLDFIIGSDLYSHGHNNVVIISALDLDGMDLNPLPPFNTPLAFGN